MRADEFLAANNFAPSRSKARALIEEGVVFYDGKLVDKASRSLENAGLVKVLESAQNLKYVSRAGLKLEKFLDELKVDVKGKICLDAGASTGGFTDCILQRGAECVFCVDVGFSQLHPKILADTRAINLEKTDVRSINSLMLFEKFSDIFKTQSQAKFDFICADLSFISLEKVLQNLLDVLKVGAEIVCLIKPQFEAGVGLAAKTNGVIKDPKILEEVVQKIRVFIDSNFPYCEVLGLIESPIKGGDGNTEYLIGLRKNTGA